MTGVQKYISITIYVASNYAYHRFWQTLQWEIETIFSKR